MSEGSEAEARRLSRETMRWTQAVYRYFRTGGRQRVQLVLGDIPAKFQYAKSRYGGAVPSAARLDRLVQIAALAYLARQDSRRALIMELILMRKRHGGRIVT